MSEFLKKHLGQLVGRKIVGICQPAGNDEFRDQVVGLMLDDNSIAWVMADPEGNGPGWLDIQKP